MTSIEMKINCENSSQNNIRVFASSFNEIYIASEGNDADDFYLKISKDDWVILKKFIDSEFLTQ